MNAPTPTGTEALVCADIAERQAVGVKKYGTTVADNHLPLSAWIRHAYQESLDLPIYLRRAEDEAKRLENEVAALKAQIRRIREVAHCGGIIGFADETQAMREIRRLSSSFGVNLEATP